ncbi:MAG: SRPBCC family protein [Geminicoccaceae bacterium]
MRKTIAIIAVVLIAVPIAAVLGLAATKPDTFRVQRATSITAPPAKIFAFINDFHSWDAWSPYEHKDPAMKRTFSGPSSGKGAVYEWEGNSDVGQGRMEITDASPPSKLTLKLDFVKPFEAHNVVDFTLEPRGDSTTVTWAMNGPTPYLAKVVHVFFDMDDMVGKDFESGLASLKALSER